MVSQTKPEDSSLRVRSSSPQDSWHATQITCFTSTKVQILTQKVCSLRARSSTLSAGAAAAAAAAARDAAAAAAAAAAPAHTHALSSPSPTHSSHPTTSSAMPAMSHDEKVEFLGSMGFSPPQAVQALLEAGGDVDKAVTLLTEE